MENIKLLIAYDGTRFFGFAKVAQSPTIEELLLNALEKILGTQISIQGASRTDRGVHALGQVVNFILPKPFPLPSLLKALNAQLPKDIRILSIERAADDFHPTLSAKSKTYRYTIDNCLVKDPFSITTAWHVHTPLDLGVIQQSASDLIGTHDFASFATKGHHEETTRTISEILITKKHHCIVFMITGNSFLYHMVRTIVGTLVYIGKQKFPRTACKELLLYHDRKKAGPAAPAHGLTLYHIDY